MNNSLSLVIHIIPFYRNNLLYHVGFTPQHSVMILAKRFNEALNFLIGNWGGVYPMIDKMRPIYDDS